MTENDYIAEYVRDKYPHILGMDFALWKLGKAIQNVANTIVTCFKKAGPIDRYEGETEDILKKIDEAGESEEEVSNED